MMVLVGSKQEPGNVPAKHPGLASRPEVRGVSVPRLGGLVPQQVLDNLDEYPPEPRRCPRKYGNEPALTVNDHDSEAPAKAQRPSDP